MKINPLWKIYLLVTVSVALVLAAVRVDTQSEPTPIISLSPVKDCQKFNFFEDEDSMKAFIDNSNGQPSGGDVANDWGRLPPSTIPLGGTAEAGGGSSDFYSPTNIQVAGVDEQDIVKTDGEYIYTVSSNGISILKAYPPGEAEVISKIELNNHIYGIFIDDDRLVVLLSNYSYNYERPGNDMFYGYYSDSMKIQLYDITDKASPNRIQEIVADGDFIGARMIEGFVYVIGYYHPYWWHDKPIDMPIITIDQISTSFPASRVGYFDDYTGGSEMTVIVALDITGENDPVVSAYLIGYAGTLYVSTEHIYIASTVYDFNSDNIWKRYIEKSTIHKIAFEGLETSYLCSAVVPGRLLNQFSMDEFNGNLRLATTIGNVGLFGDGTQNNVYVLDSTFAALGRLEGLAPGEQIYSARFLGDRGYLVTFKKVDPFFVIDLSDPAEPQVLGYLKIPGFSNYLHPYGENYVIGIGKDTIESESGNFAWFQGLKLSLFDVTDVEHPREVSKVVIGDRGTDSEALQEHKAFLFSAQRGLLVIPVNLVKNDAENPENRPPWIWNGYSWQGVYVFSVSQEGGFVLKGRITHGAIEDNYRYNYSLFIRRSLYIDDVLYTISNNIVKMNELENLSEIGHIEL